MKTNDKIIQTNFVSTEPDVRSVDGVQVHNNQGNSQVYEMMLHMQALEEQGKLQCTIA